VDRQSPWYRYSVLALGGVGLVVIFATTERCFDNADLKNAQKMVQTLRAQPGSPTIPEAIAAEHPGAGPIAWQSELRDKFFGFVHVTGVLSDAGKPIVYEFDVNLAGQRLHPGNERAKALMEKLAPGSTAAPAEASGPSSHGT
jgi:hypothetical protein